MNNRTRRSENGGLIIAVLALFVICIVATLSVILNPQNGNSIVLYPATTEAIPINPNTATPKPTSTAIINLTPILTPSQRVEGLQVLEWNIDYICNGTDTPGVQILGALISGGIPPYWIEASYIDGTVFPIKKAKIVNTSPTGIRVKLDIPISVSSGRRVLIAIKSNSDDGKPELVQDLYFPSKESGCPK